MYVIVHIWEDNANVYGSREAAIAGIANNHDEHEETDVAVAVEWAITNPGEAASIDQGMSTVRYLSITNEVD